MRLAIAAGLAASLIRLQRGPVTVDDAYITFRYARNIAEGAGFAYNPGEPVLGTTTPLYALLMAAAYRLGATDLPTVASIVNSMADGLTTALLFWLAVHLGTSVRWATIAALLFAISSRSIPFAAGGMETSVFVLLLVIAASADLTGRPAIAGFAAGLATLTRPDGLIMAAMVLGRHLLNRRLPPWRAVIGFALPLLPWLAFAIWYFGSPLPQSMQAKSAVFQGTLQGNVWTWLEGFAVGDLLLAVLVTPLAPVLVRAARKRNSLLPLSMFAPALAVAYLGAAIRGVPVCQWYLVPVVPFLLLAAGKWAYWMSKSLPRPGTVFLAVGLFGLSAVNLIGALDPGRGALAPLHSGHLVRERAYIAAARSLAPAIGPETVVALPEIGAFGYVSGARILDTVGLVSPGATRFYPVPPEMTNGMTYVISPSLIQELLPDFIVALESFYPAGLASSGWFRDSYQLRSTVPATVWNAQAVLVYERR